MKNFSTKDSFSRCPFRRAHAHLSVRGGLAQMQVAKAHNLVKPRMLLMRAGRVQWSGEE